MKGRRGAERPEDAAGASPLAHAVGTALVHVQHGAATVAGTQRRDVGNGEIDMAVLEIIGSASDLTVMVPVEQLSDDEVVRAPMGADRAREVLGLFEQPVVLPDFADTAWTAHFKQLGVKARSGDPMQVAEVLTYVAARPDPSPAEMTVAGQCRRMLTAELAAALSVDADEAATMLDHAETSVVAAEDA